MVPVPQIWRVRENYLGKGNNKQTKRPLHVARIQSITASRKDRTAFTLTVQAFYRPDDTTLSKHEADNVCPRLPTSFRYFK